MHHYKSNLQLGIPKNILGQNVGIEYDFLKKKIIPPILNLREILWTPSETCNRLFMYCINQKNRIKSVNYHFQLLIC